MGVTTDTLTFTREPVFARSLVTSASEQLMMSHAVRRAAAAAPRNHFLHLPDARVRARYLLLKQCVGCNGGQSFFRDTLC